MNYGGSHHLANSQGNDQSCHRLNVAPLCPQVCPFYYFDSREFEDLWHLISLNIDSSDSVMHHVRTARRLPYPPPPNNCVVAHFMSFNMSNNGLATALPVTGGFPTSQNQIWPPDIVLQFDDAQTIDQSISTGVVANPVQSVTFYVTLLYTIVRN